MGSWRNGNCLTEGPNALKDYDQDLILMRHFENRWVADIGERPGLSLSSGQGPSDCAVIRR